MAGVRRFVVTLLIALVLAPTAATAHSSWVETNPDHGAVLATLPEVATVTVSEEPQKADVVLKTPNATTLKLKAQVDGGTITADLPDEGPRGDYTLSYRVVSADGHPVTGSATFTITTGPAPVEPEPTPAPTASAASEPASALPSLAIAGGAALVALATGLLFWLMRR